MYWIFLQNKSIFRPKKKNKRIWIIIGEISKITSGKAFGLSKIILYLLVNVSDQQNTEKNKQKHIKLGKQVATRTTKT